MSGANSVRGASSLKGASKGELRVKDMDKSATTDLGQIDIEGRIYKPSVFYVLARSGIDYKLPEISNNFVPRILTGAFKRPF